MALVINGNSDNINDFLKELNSYKKYKKQMYKDLKIRNTKYCFMTKF